MTTLPIYTQIYIHYISSALNAFGDPLGDSEFTFRITPPLSRAVGPFQSLPEHIHLRVKLNEPVILNLLPSESYRPFGRYKVEVFRKGQLSNSPITTMFWTVPYNKEFKYLDLVVTNPNEPIALYIATAKVISIHPEYPFRLDSNVIYWTDENNKPALGETVTISALPFCTLEELLDEQ